VRQTAIAILVLAGTASAQMLRLPLRFEPNAGQAPPETLFESNGLRQRLTLERDALSLQVFSPGENPRAAAIRFTWLGARGAASAEPSERLPGVSHYYIGDRPSEWRTNVPHYGRVTLREIYPGVDLVCYGKDGRLEYDLALSPQADPSQVRFRIDGADGVQLTSGGDLLLDTAAGPVRWQHPVSYQSPTRGARRAVSSRYRLGADGRTVSFQLGAYDRTQPLIIDPVLLFSTVIGGNDTEVGGRIAIDPSGNSYIGGVTYSRNLTTNPPTVPGLQLKGLYDGMVAKLNAAGTQALYITYLGGEDLDIINGIAVDARGAAYVSGQTNSRTFPVTPGAAKTSRTGYSDVLVAKLNPDGTLAYGTLFGGVGGENSTEIKVDAQGAAFVTGYTTDPLPVTENAAQRNYGGGKSDAYVFKLSPDGTHFDYITHFGGRGDEEPGQSVGERLPRLGFIASFGLVIDGQGNAWIAGSTTSTDLPITTRNVGAFAGGLTDIYLAKLNPAGSEFTYISYVGGGGLDLFNRMVLDAQGNVHLVAHTNSRNLPTTPNALYKAFLGGEFDGYYCKVAADGSSILYGSYIGGQSDDYLNALAVTSAGEVLLGGMTNSINFPVTADALDPGPPRKFAAFFAALNAAGSQLLTSGFFGGTDVASLADIQLDPEGNVYLSGLAGGPGFTTTTGSYDPTYNGGLYDFYVAKLLKLGGTSGGPAPSPSGCAFTLSPGILDLAGDAVVAEVNVRTGPDCEWNVSVTNLPWVNLIGTAQRRGAGIVYLNVAASPEGARAGTVQVAGREVIVRQARRDTSGPQAPTPLISTLAGNGTKGPRTDSGPALSAQFTSISGIAFDNRGNLFISDAEQHIIRRVRADGIIEMWAGIIGISAFTGDGGPAIQARLNEPEGLATDSLGNLYVADKGNRRIRKITPDGTISTIAGTGVVGQDGDGEAATRATFREPANLLIDAANNIYIADRSGNRIRKITASTGIITTIAGTGESGFSGDKGPAISARILSPAGMAFDAQGQIYFADQLNQRIRRILSNGNIETVAGNGVAAWGGDNQPAIDANLNAPFGVAFARDGNLYITDRDNHRIRRVDAKGVITHFAGDGNPGFLGENAAPNVTRFSFPTALVADAAGNLVLADSGNGSLRVRKIAFPLPPPPTTAIRAILNAFGSQAVISPLSLAAIYGENFTTETQTWDASLADGKVPEQLAGISVQFNNRPAAVAFVSPNQINFLVPADLSGAGPVPVTVVTPNSKGTATAFLADVSPALVAFPVGDRTSVLASIDGEETLVAPSGAIEGRDTRPGRIGDTIVLAATGLGLTDPLPPSGTPLTEPLPLANPDRLKVTIGGQAASVVSAQMTSLGVFTVKLQIPEGAGTGWQPVVLRVNEQPAQSALVISLEE
jgi:uncharacterized protein (TIGR03437 family)